MNDDVVRGAARARRADSGRKAAIAGQVDLAFFNEVADALAPLDPAGALADEIGCGRRTVERWQSGKNALPAWIGKELRGALRRRRDEIDGLLQRLGNGENDET